MNTILYVHVIDSGNYEKSISRNYAKKQSKVLKRTDLREDDESFLEAIRTVQRWRNQCVPATEKCFQEVLNCARNIEGSVAAYRMKRVDSIVSKIRRPNSNFELHTLDDIGGCRLIVEHIEDLAKAKEFLIAALGDRVINIKNYVDSPKESGYRSCHLLTQQIINNLSYRVEIQIRTKLQHYWATAVEVADEIYDSALKSPTGFELSERKDLVMKKDFFALTASLFALEENKPIVPNTPRGKPELLQKLKSIPDSKKIINDIKTVCENVFLAKKVTSVKNPEVFILSFERSEQFLEIEEYSQRDLQEALTRYESLEKSIIAEPGVTSSKPNVVLVYMQDSEQLKIAYPNYSANAPDFIQKVGEYLREN